MATGSGPYLSECLLRRLLFCFLLTSPGPHAHDLTLNGQFHLEYLLVVGPYLSNGRIAGQCVILLLTPLLKLGLVVARSRLLLLRGNMRKFLCETVPRHRAACLDSS